MPASDTLLDKRRTPLQIGDEEWRPIAEIAARNIGTPCYVTWSSPVAAALTRLQHSLEARVPIRPWLSFKTHPLPALLQWWHAKGRGVEVVSEHELAVALASGCDPDALLVNGVAKHTWLLRYSLPGLRVHFDSLRELHALLPIALEQHWRVGVRVHAPDERTRDGQAGGQFGMTPDEAADALTTLEQHGAEVQSMHFHLGQRTQDGEAFERAVNEVADVCRRARFAPRFLDLGGSLPSARNAALALAGLQRAVLSAERVFPSLEEIWLENGRFVTEDSSALLLRVVDIKERPDARYLICDGGRTNHALAADHGLHPILTLPARSGTPCPTAVCGPTCMTDDTLGRTWLPSDVECGDVLAWLHAGAYHLPWETRFSHGLCAVAWCDEEQRLTLARPRELPDPSVRTWNL